jgi:hypothetical protein
MGISQLTKNVIIIMADRPTAIYNGNIISDSSTPNAVICLHVSLFNNEMPTIDELITINEYIKNRTSICNDTFPIIIERFERMLPCIMTFSPFFGQLRGFLKVDRKPASRDHCIHFDSFSTVDLLNFL